MNKYSYVTLLSDDSYIYGIILLQESLKKVNTKYPLMVLVTSNVTPPIINILEQLELKYKIIEPIRYEHILAYNKKSNPLLAKVWLSCLTKLKIFEMTEMDKWLFLDADIMVMKNLDHLFEHPHLTSALDGEYFNLWPEWDHFNSGILVIEPNKQEYDNIINFILNDALNEEWRPNECIADQEILNHYYKDWPNKPELHLNKYYDIFAPYIQENQIPDVDENCYFIHFVGRKPWRAFTKSAQETYTEKYYDIARKMIEKKILTINWDKVRDQIKIAIYGICKNEINKIDEFLKCFTVADYVCLLDTGSTDGTWEFLQGAQKTYSNLIIDQINVQPWRYDTARNLSLKLVPNDTTIYFMMDLDEIIKQKDWTKLIKGCWDPLFSRGRYIYNRYIDEKTDTPTHTFFEHRIHNNCWHYKGIVHEQLVNISGTRDFYDDECIYIPITVWHYPTHLNRETYIELCEQGVQEEPNNWLMHMQLAIEYEVHEKYEQAAEEYKKIIIESNTLSPIEIGRCYASLGRIYQLMNNTEEAIRVVARGREVVPIYGDNYFLGAELAYYAHDFKQAFDLCEQGLKNSCANQWCSIIDRDGYFPWLLMGLAQFYLNNKILGLGYMAIAREKNNSEENNHIYNEMLTEIINRG